MCKQGMAPWEESGWFSELFFVLGGAVKVAILYVCSLCMGGCFLLRYAAQHILMRSRCQVVSRILR